VLIGVDVVDDVTTLAASKEFRHASRIRTSKSRLAKTSS